MGQSHNEEYVWEVSGIFFKFFAGESYTSCTLPSNWHTLWAQYSISTGSEGAQHLTMAENSQTLLPLVI